MTEIWDLVHAERAALAADLAGCTDEQWDTPSLCAGLTVRQVLAHVTSAAGLTPMRWMWGVIRCRFDFDKQVAMRLAEQMGADGAETLARFRSVVTSTTTPPLPLPAMLGETIVHGEDIRRPLGIKHDYPIAALTAPGRVLPGHRPGRSGQGRIQGLRLVATDGPFATGAGPLVTGPTLALIMAMVARGAATGACAIRREGTRAGPERRPPAVPYSFSAWSGRWWCPGAGRTCSSRR